MSNFKKKASVPQDTDIRQVGDKSIVLGGTLRTSEILVVSGTDNDADLIAVSGALQDQIDNIVVSGGGVTSVNGEVGDVEISTNGLESSFTPANFTAPNSSIDGFFEGIDTRIGELGSISSAGYDAVYHISISGSDLTGDGSLNSPYSTIQKIKSLLPGNLTSKVAIVFGVGSYPIVDDSLVLNPGIHLVGQGEGLTFLELAGNLILNSGANFDEPLLPQSNGLYNLTVLNYGVSLTVESFTLNPTAVWSMKLQNVKIQGGLNVTGRSFCLDSIEINNVSVNGASAFFNLTSTVRQLVCMNDVGFYAVGTSSTLNVEVNNSVFKAQFQLFSNASYLNTYIYNSNLAYLESNNGPVNIYIDAISCPPESTLTIPDGGNTFNRITEAYGIVTLVSPGNYTISGDTVKEHFIGIDNALGIVPTLEYIDSQDALAVSSGYSSLLSTSGVLQSGIDSAFDSINATPLDRVLHVAVSGSDITGNGSLGAPFATVEYALTQVPSGLDINTSYVISLGAGSHSTPTCKLKPFVALVGKGYITTRLNVANNKVELEDSGSPYDGNSRNQIHHLQLSGSTGIDMDFSGYSNASNVLDISECWINGPVTYTGRAYGAEYIQAYNTFFFGSVNINNAHGETVMCTFTSSFNLNISSMSAGSLGFSVHGSRFGSTVNAVSDNSRTLAIGITSTELSTVSLNGDGITATFDIVSMPDDASITMAGGAVAAKNRPFPRSVTTPLLTSSYGLQGDYAVDSNYRYECISTNYWVRTAVEVF